MILERYILREIFKPTAAICTALMFVFGCYIAGRYLDDAVQGQLPGTAVILLILLRIAIALEVLLPTTLYLSVIVALGRLYRDGEMTAMAACGFGPARVVKTVFAAAVIAGVLVAALSLHIRPWAWKRFFDLKARARAGFDISRMKGGTFYELENGRRVVFAESVDPRGRRAGKVFIRTRREDALQIIHAGTATQRNDAVSGRPVIVFEDGRLYEFPLAGNDGRILRFERSVMPLDPPDAAQGEFRVKAEASGRLRHSDDPEEIAEWQWRLTAPLSTVMLALLAVPLSRSSPRRGKFAGMPLAIVVFAVYYHLEAIAKKWVAQGVVGAFPGVWWVQACLAALVLWLLWRRVRAGLA